MTTLGSTGRNMRGFTHKGFIKLGEETHPCELTNLSATGATLHLVALIDLPARFTVQLTTDGKVVRICSVVWNEGTRVGVVFK